MKVRFYKEEDNRWYADLPDLINKGIDKSELEMVSGADIMLDILSNKGDNVMLNISEDKKDCKTHLILVENGGEAGSNYIASGETGEYEVWLCPILSLVFNKYPENLYIN